VRERFAEQIRERTSAEWSAVFEGTDACVAAALALDEVLENAHLAARGTYVEEDGLLQPAPAPRFGSTPTVLPPPAPPLGADSRAILEELGLTDKEIDDLIDENVVGAPSWVRRRGCDV
jgi:alpha-methylacyl-CoA racemase